MLAFFLSAGRLEFLALFLHSKLQHSQMSAKKDVWSSSQEEPYNSMKIVGGKLT